MLLLCLQSCYLLMRKERKRVNCWWMSFVCLLSFVFTTKIEFSECCAWFQYFTQWCYSCVSKLVVCWREDKGKKSELLMDVFCGCLSSVFTAKIELSECCVWFQRFTQWCYSCVSNLVPCLWEEKGNDEARILLQLVNNWKGEQRIDLRGLWKCCLKGFKKGKSSLLVDVFCVSSFFCLHYLDWDEWVFCLISMIHSMTLHLLLQRCYLFML